MKYILVLIICVFTFSCSTIPHNDPTYDSSFHDPNRNLGFGYQEVSENYYLITYKTKVTWAYSKFEDSWKEWEIKAKEICGTQNVVRRNEKETMGNNNPPGWLQTVSANADCTGSAEQEMIAKERQYDQEKKEEYKQLSTQSPCNVTVTSENIDDIYIWAQDFYKYELFKSSMSCFTKVLEYAPDNTESMEHIAMMYEKGNGVDKDLAKASLWYKKAQEN